MGFNSGFKGLMNLTMFSPFIMSSNSSFRRSLHNSFPFSLYSPNWQKESWQTFERDFWTRETGTGQQVAQHHDRYLMMMMTKLHLVGISIEPYYDARIHEYQKTRVRVSENLQNFAAFAKLRTASISFVIICAPTWNDSTDFRKI